MSRRGGGDDGIFLVVAVLALLGLAGFSKWLGCDFMTLLKVVPYTVGIAVVAGIAIHCGLDALATVLVAMALLWGFWFPVMDSISLDGRAPTLTDQLPLWVEFVKWGGVAVFSGLAAWRIWHIWRN